MTWGENMGKRIGLALGGGSARGLAHIGVIDALEDNGIRPDIIAGTSIGSVVGAAYAAGEHERLREFALSVDLWRMLSFFQVKIPRTGLLDGEKLARFFRENIRIPNIEDLSKPFAAICCDYLTGARVVIDRGDIISAVRSSCSIPGLFTPVKRDNALLVDGGLVDSVPVSAAREMGADVIIAVDLNYHVRFSGINNDIRERRKKPGPIMNHPLTKLLESKFTSNKKKDISPGIVDMLLDSFFIMQRSLTDINLKSSDPEILIRPHLENIKVLEFTKAEEGISIGRKITEGMMDDILKILD